MNAYLNQKHDMDMNWLAQHDYQSSGRLIPLYSF